MAHPTMRHFCVYETFSDFCFIDIYLVFNTGFLLYSAASTYTNVS